MTDIPLLKSLIANSGMTMIAISRKANIRRETLYNRLSGIGDFTASEIVGLSSALRLDFSTREKVFFCKKSRIK